MFSSSFTMSEQKHLQWTPYKHAAPALRAASLVYSPHCCFGEAEQLSGGSRRPLRRGKRSSSQRLALLDRCKKLERYPEARTASSYAQA